MKTRVIFYWIVTALFCLMMTGSAVSQVFSSKDALSVMDALRLPAYLLPFLGTAKILGVIALLIPGRHLWKEWAYAGFLFDLAGATFCMIAVGGAFAQWGFMLVPISVLGWSYICFRRIRATE